MTAQPQPVSRNRKDNSAANPIFVSSGGGTFGNVVIVDDGGVVMKGRRPAATSLPVAVSDEDYATLVSMAGSLATIAARLDVALSTRASEATLALIRADLAAVLANFDVALSTRASEATLAALKATADAVLAQLDVALSTRASEATLAALKARADLLATEATLAAILAKLNTINDPIGVEGADQATQARGGNGLPLGGNGLPVRGDVNAGTAVGAGEPMFPAGFIRNDAPVALFPTNGRWTQGSVDNFGSLWVRNRVVPRPSQGQHATTATARTYVEVDTALSASAGGVVYTVPSGKVLYITSCWLAARRTDQINGVYLNLEYDNGPALLYPLRIMVPGAHVALTATGVVIGTAQDGHANGQYTLAEPFRCERLGGTGQGEVRIASGVVLANLAGGFVGYLEDA